MIGYFVKRIALNIKLTTMKKLIYFFILILFSCTKKEEAQPIVNSTNHEVEVIVDSNHRHPFFSFENGTVTIKRMNQAAVGYKDMVKIIYNYNATEKGRYRAHTESAKNATDSTYDMLDTLPLWNRMIVKVDGVVIYDVKDTIPLIQHSFYFDLQ